MEDSMYGSGILHGYVKDAEGNVYDIDGIMGVDPSPEMETTEISGDDEIKATFVSNQKETLTVTANSVSYEAMSAITGATVTNVAAVPYSAGPPEVLASPARKEIAGGTASEMNPPFVELGFVTNGKDSAGNTVHFKRVFHRAQCKPIKTPQQNGSELSIEFEATAYPTSVDIEGHALATRRIDTKAMINGPYVAS